MSMGNIWLRRVGYPARTRDVSEVGGDSLREEEWNHALQCRRKWEEGNECGGFMCVRGEVGGASAETDGDWAWWGQ